MSKPVSYCLAAKRHYQDAELLLNAGRKHNAGQLYGFVAECGIKSLLIGNGYSSNPTTGEIIQKNEKFREHAHVLVQNIHMVTSYLSGRGAAKYMSMLPNIGNLQDWHTCHRYYIESAIPSSVASWRIAAIEVMKMLDQALQDGMQE